MDHSIFSNQSEVAENMREAAKTIGASADGMDSLKEGLPVPVLVSKSSCKMCWGRGVIKMIPDKEKKLTDVRCRCVRVQFI